MREMALKLDEWKITIFTDVLNRMKEEEILCLFLQGAPGGVGLPGPKGMKGDSRTITTKGQSSVANQFLDHLSFYGSTV